MAVVTERTRDMMVVQIRVDELRDLLHGSVAGARVQVGGDDSVIRDEMRTSQSDVVRGEAIALPCCSRCCSCSVAGAPPWCRWPGGPAPLWHQFEAVGDPQRQPATGLRIPGPPRAKFAHNEEATS